MDKNVRRQEFGAKLKAARMAQGLDIAALSQLTRITHAFLQTLEAGDFDRLPGAVFGRGFVRSIARATHQDPVALVAEFDELFEREPPKSVLKVEIKNKPTITRGEGFRTTVLSAGSLMRRGAAAKMLVPIAVVVVAAFAVARSGSVRNFVKNRVFTDGAASVAVPAKTIELPAAPEAVQPAVAKSETESIPDATAAVPATPADAAAAPAPTVAALSTDQTLELVVTEAVRIRLEVDGAEAVTKELSPDTYKFTFKDKADVMVYDAAAVKVSYNGRALGSLGTKGRVRRLSFAAGTATRDEM